ncbi:ABC transporter ATP-binding protein [Epidermidibacterium keratini]|uniref:ABC transporter ATP-binding protein n=1 Tax=Epidermidibacterium keratini TaxID=1891644 RepID=UPI001CEFAB93|nr:ABC transporter ATP-binding protein [Epidermidibacterium keratini]
MSFLDAHVDVPRRDFDVTLDLLAEPGEVIALLGPNGSGKSTTLGALVGLIAPRSGHVRVGGEVLHDLAEGIWLPPDQRGVGMVFQNGRLFPHLSALDNVAFGPRSRGASKGDAETTARAALARIGALELAAAKPGGLSGGQAQRVALARALATDPGLLLLDEPMSALDARSRIAVRAELRTHLADFDGVAIVVTHDLYDAAALADRMLVIEHGRVVQSGTPYDVASRPATDYVADLAGVVVLPAESDGRLLRLAPGYEIAREHEPGEVQVVVHPRDVRLREDDDPGPGWPATVDSIDPQGTVTRVGLVCRDGPRIVSEVDTLDVGRRRLAPGVPARAWVDSTNLVVYRR